MTDPIDQGETAGGHSGVSDEGFAQGFPANPVTDHIDDGGGQGGGDMKPMIQQKAQTQLSALRYAGESMDIVKTECQYGASQKR